MTTVLLILGTLWIAMGTGLVWLVILDADAEMSEIWNVGVWTWIKHLYHGAAKAFQAVLRA